MHVPFCRLCKLLAEGNNYFLVHGIEKVSTDFDLLTLVHRGLSLSYCCMFNLHVNDLCEKCSLLNIFHFPTMAAEAKLSTIKTRGLYIEP